MGAGLHDACGAESERRHDFAEDQRVVARVEQQVDLKHKHKRKHVNGRGAAACQRLSPLGRTSCKPLRFAHSNSITSFGSVSSTM
jgi:peptide subunit release factor 1 (eRF1)